MEKKYIDKDFVIDATNKGETSVDIARKLGTCSATIRQFKKVNNIQNMGIQLTEMQKQFIVGSCLGDGSILKGKTSSHYEFICQHGMRQYDYLLWKAEILKSLGSSSYKYIRKTPNKVTNKLYEYCLVRTKINPNLIYFRNLLYVDNKKVIQKELLQYYSTFAMAVHYMDDGFSPKRNSYRLSTDCFDIKSLIVFKDFLEETYNIKTSITKSHKMTILKESRDHFDSLIRPYVEKINCMKYKLIK